MGCEGKMICYDCGKSVELGKIYQSLSEKESLKMWLFLRDHDGHRVGLITNGGEHEDFYFEGWPEEDYSEEIEELKK